MLTARGLRDHLPIHDSQPSESAAAVPTTPRSRSELELQCKQQQRAWGAAWSAAQAAKETSREHVRTVAASAYRRCSAAAVKKAAVPPPATAPPPPSAAAADSVGLTAAFVLRGGSCAGAPSTAASASATDARGAPRGVRHVAGRSRNAECEHHFKDAVSKRTFPRPFVHEQHGSAADHAAPMTHFPTADGAPADETPRPVIKPELPHSARKHRPLTATVGRVANVPYMPDPPVASLRKMFVMRPEVTANDSFQVPVYSSFTLNHRFDPLLDEALKPYFRRRQKRREEALAKLKQRHVSHSAALAEYNFALAAKLSLQQLLAVPPVDDAQLEAAKQSQVVCAPHDVSPRGPQGRATQPVVAAAVAAVAPRSRGASTTATPSTSPLQAPLQVPPANVVRGATAETATVPAARTTARQRVVPAPVTAGEMQVSRRPQTAQVRRASAALQVVFADGAARVATPTWRGGSGSGTPRPPQPPSPSPSAAADELARLEQIFATTRTPSRPASARRPLCSPTMAIEFGVARQDAPAAFARAFSAVSSSARSGGVTDAAASSDVPPLEDQGSSQVKN